MTRSIFVAGALALAVLTGPTGAMAASVDIGTANSANCIPFSCLGIQRYQQVYSAGLFAAPLSFDQVSFFADSSFVPGLGTVIASYEVAFYLTDRTPLDLGSDLDANQGALLGTVGVADLDGGPVDLLSFTGARIDYDPLAGNLLMDIRKIGPDPAVLPAISLLFAIENESTGMARRFVTEAGTTSGANIGLVTRFTLTDVSAPVPEPAAWAMLIAGFGLAGAALRRRPRAVRFA